MRPTKIVDIMNLAYKVNKMGGKFNPLFIGPAGIGKSEIIQAWCNSMELPFLDLRAAYLEAPDVIGFPFRKEVDGKEVQFYATPAYWPTEGEGVVFLDEVNRGNTSVMNTFMQLLTDRKIHDYHLPKGWFIVSAINPETAENDVNTMDAAFRNRFSAFEVEFDKTTFIDYMKDNEWDKSLVQFVESGLWTFSKPEDVGNKPGDKYVSSRSLSKVNAMLKAGFNVEDEMLLFESELGRNYASSFYKFRHDERPVSYKDLLLNAKASLARLAAYSDPSNYKNAQISVTVRDVIEDGTIEDDLLSDISLTIPADQGYFLIRELEKKKNDNNLLTRLLKKNKELKIHFSKVVKG